MTLVILPQKIQLNKIFNDTKYEDESIVRNKCSRNFETESSQLSLIINDIENLTPYVITYAVK